MKWYEIKNKSDRAEIWIYEMIGEDFFSGSGITADSFRKDLHQIKAQQIDLHINSPGGYVFDGLAIYNILKQHPAEITTYIDGIAASISSVIALAGNKIYMAENAIFMIHNPYGLVMGGSSEMRKMADELDIVRGSIAKAYISKTGMPEDEVYALMDAETWMNAEEALEYGFIDDLTDRMDMAACAKFAPMMVKAGFKKIPDEIVSQKKPTVKNAEKALRDVGYSVKQAKTILAKGIPDGLRDVDLMDEPKAANPLRDVEDVVPEKSEKPMDRTTALIMKAKKAQLNSLVEEKVNEDKR